MHHDGHHVYVYPSGEMAAAQLYVFLQQISRFLVNEQLVLLGVSCVRLFKLFYTVTAVNLPALMTKTQRFFSFTLSCHRENVSIGPVCASKIWVNMNMNDCLGELWL